MSFFAPRSDTLHRLMRFSVKKSTRPSHKRPHSRWHTNYGRRSEICGWILVKVCEEEGRGIVNNRLYSDGDQFPDFKMKSPHSRSHQPLQQHFSNCSCCAMVGRHSGSSGDRELWPRTLTFQLVLDSGEMNQHARYLGHLHRTDLFTRITKRSVGLIKWLIKYVDLTVKNSSL